jgi:hypothetical protein
MDMETILTYIFVAGVAFWLGVKLTNLWNIVVLKELLSDLGISDQQLKAVADKHGMPLDIEPDAEEPEMDELEIRIEQHQGTLYAFRVEDDRFMGQGVDRDALIARIAEDVNDVRLIIREENGAALIKGSS